MEADQRETLRLLIGESSSKLRRAVAGLDDELLQRRPGPHLNPIGFIYFHVLRSWDEDLNILCRGRSPDQDTWHRAGLSEEFDYEPLGRGKGGRGVGVGFSDDEVDAVPRRLDALSRYHDLLDSETSSYLESATNDELTQTREYASTHPHLGAFSPAGLMRLTALHHAEHSGDIKFVKGMLGMPDPTYPGPS